MITERYKKAVRNSIKFEDEMEKLLKLKSLAAIEENQAWEEMRNQTLNETQS